MWKAWGDRSASEKARVVVNVVGSAAALLLVGVGALLPEGVGGLMKQSSTILLNLGTGILAAFLFYFIFEMATRARDREEFAELATAVEGLTSVNESLSELSTSVDGLVSMSNGLAAEVSRSVEPVVTAAFARNIPRRLPTHEFAASETPDHNLNSLLQGDVTKTDVFLFCGASARTMATRLLCIRPGTKLAVRVVVPDPACDAALRAQSRYYEATQSASYGAEKVKKSIAAGLYGLYLTSKYANMLGYGDVRVSFTSSPHSRRFEICRAVSAWVTFPTADDDERYPRTARFDKGSDLYRMHVQEVEEAEELAADLGRSFTLNRCVSWREVVSTVGLDGFEDEEVLRVAIRETMTRMGWAARGAVTELATEPLKA